MSDQQNNGDGADKHAGARQLAEAALRADREGDSDQADELFAQAEKADPSAVLDVVGDQGVDAVPLDQTGDELETMSETVIPGSSAPSRAGITGTGSGADGQGL